MPLGFQKKVSESIKLGSNSFVKIQILVRGQNTPSPKDPSHFDRWPDANNSGVFSAIRDIFTCYEENITLFASNCPSSGVYVRGTV